MEGGMNNGKLISAKETANDGVFVEAERRA